jgi:hypothetical protein
MPNMHSIALARDRATIAQRRLNFFERAFGIAAGGGKRAMESSRRDHTAAPISNDG